MVKLVDAEGRSDGETRPQRHQVWKAQRGDRRSEQRAHTGRDAQAGETGNGGRIAAQCDFAQRDSDECAVPTHLGGDLVGPSLDRVVDPPSHRSQRREFHHRRRYDDLTPAIGQGQGLAAVGDVDGAGMVDAQAPELAEQAPDAHAAESDQGQGGQADPGGDCLVDPDGFGAPLEADTDHGYVGENGNSNDEGGRDSGDDDDHQGGGHEPSTDEAGVGGARTWRLRRHRATPAAEP